MPKSLTTSVYTFEKLITEDFLYVDKTEYIYPLIHKTGQYFLSRPRRFGKSLLISTLKAIFDGKKELFKGLALYDKEFSWQPHPVIHLDMGSTASTDLEELKKNLLRIVNQAAADNDCPVEAEAGYQALEDLINALHTRDGKVVILIDEYDKPLLGHLGQDSAPEVQGLLKQFYSVVKTTEQAQRFVLLTGVSKFSKVSVFSDLNNLTDLTMSRQAATLLGYTQEEVEENFPDYIKSLAGSQNKSEKETLDELRIWYNGYRFEEKSPTVYNPVSLMKCLMGLKFKNYWFETGTPTFLLDLLKAKPLDLGNLTASEDSFSVYEAHQLHSLPLLFQTGYLTIKEAFQTGRRRQFRLGFPNFEIEESLSMAMASAFANLEMQDANSALNHMVDALETNDIDGMLEHLKTFFSSVPYDIVEQKEKYYQTIFFTVFKLIGAMIEAEVRTNLGRVDAVVKTPSTIFLFEFKLNGSAEEALAQIHEKDYAAAYGRDPRPTLLIGVSFNPKLRNLDKWVVEKA